MKKNILDNPFFLFLLFIAVVIINTISSIYFSSIMLAGFVFLAFIKCIRNKYYYSMFFITLAMLFIELNNGFPPFTLLLLSMFSYMFVIPKIKKVISFSGLNYFIYIIWFYAAMFVIWSILEGIDITLVGTIFLNIIIDFILVGLFLWDD